MNVKEILEERGKTHGDFTDNARVAQELKRAIQSGPNWDELTNVQKEALHMICHKMARIVSGDACEEDHWSDIAGYAQLVVDRL